MIIDHIKRFTHINIVPTSLPISAERKENGKILVEWQNTENQNEKSTKDEFDTVLMAVGRTANTEKLNLNKAGVKVNPKTKKIVGSIANELELTHN